MPMKGVHGFNKQGKPIHRYGCLPRAISIVFGRHMGNYSYSDIVTLCRDVCRERGVELDLNEGRLFYHGIGSRDQYEICKRMGLRYVELIEPMPMKYGACLWNNFVAITADHAVPYKDCCQVPNSDLLGDSAPAHAFLAPPDGGQFTL